MRVIFDHHSSGRKELVFPRVSACYHCKSVLYIEQQDVKESEKGANWNRDAYWYFDCPLCKQHTIIH
jgi:hypothetical protein